MGKKKKVVEELEVLESVSDIFDGEEETQEEEIALVVEQPEESAIPVRKGVVHTVAGSYITIMCDDGTLTWKSKVKGVEYFVGQEIEY